MKSRETSFHLGYYAGCLISEAPSDYLEWVIEKDVEYFGDEIKDIAREEFNFRTKVKGHWNGHQTTYQAYSTCK